MDRIGFDGRERGLRLHARDLVEEGDVLVGEPNTGVTGRVGRGGEPCGYRVVEIAQQETLRDAEPQTLQRRGFQRPGTFAREHGVGSGAARDRLGDGSDRIERVGQRKRAIGGHAEFARLVSHNAAQGRGHASRTAGVAADADFAHAVGHRDSGARR